MIQRNIKKQLKELAQQFPIVSVTGPRQSGKTTLIKQTFKNYKYINLEEPATQAKAKSDPTEFLRSFDSPVIIDEAQYVPYIFSSVQVLSDEKEKPGQFILSGSQNFLLLKNINQSLAGRVGILTLLTLDYNEYKSWNNKANYVDFMINGGYPRIYNSKISSNKFYKSYLKTYIKKDVEGYLDVRNSLSFEAFVKILATRSGQLLNYSSLAKEVSISLNTVKSWISILCSSNICFLLHPYYKNINKRLTKTPKIYFTDTGLLSYLLGVFNANEYQQSNFKGAIFENFIISETLKHYYNCDEDFDLFFYRDDEKTEVDLLDLSKSANINLCEIKSSSLYNAKFTRPLKKVSSYLNIPLQNSCIVYGGQGNFKDGKVQIIDVDSWTTKKQIFKEISESS